MSTIERNAPTPMPPHPAMANVFAMKVILMQICRTMSAESNVLPLVKLV